MVINIYQMKNKIKMHIINYNSTGESSFKIYITTNSTYIIFNNTNYNNITFNLDTPLTIGVERHEFLISLSNLQIPISWPLISSYIGNNYFVLNYLFDFNKSCTRFVDIFYVFYLISYDSIDYLFLVLLHIHML